MTGPDTIGAGLDGGARLRVLVADERAGDLELLARAAELVGGAVVAQETRVKEVAHVACEEAAELALVGLAPGASAPHALALIGQLVGTGRCPIVLATATHDPATLAEAARLGVYAHAAELGAVPLGAAIDVALRRFDEHAALRSAFVRRLVIERAKGVLMGRYELDEQHAFELLRRHTRSEQLKLVVAAERVLAGHRLLPQRARRGSVQGR